METRATLYHTNEGSALFPEGEKMLDDGETE
jgi:hypothetical protein